ncbi:MAG TPA: GldM family protein, partial [Bacteroidales bacterium]|nr:GldM family protein [Bacteroidales bacterium]
MNPAKVGEHYDKAKLAREYSKELINYIDRLMLGMVAFSEREDTAYILENHYKITEVPDLLDRAKTVKKRVLDLQSIPTKDKFDRTTTYMITQGRANEFKEKIDEYRVKMEALIPEEYRHRIEIGLQTEEDYYDADGNKQNWQMYNFYHTILAADITILNKIIAEVQTTEFDVVSEIFSEITLTDYKFDDVTAKIIPKTSYVIQGQNYEAEVLVAAYDTKQNPAVYILQGADEITNANLSNAQKWEGRDGMVKLEWTANREGMHKFAGIIEIKSPEGEPERYPFVHEYIVAPPSLTVAAKKMNVFYRGVDNPVSISVPGIAKEKIRPTISVGSISPDPKDRGDWIVRMPADATKATVGASAEIDGTWMNMGAFEFRVKRVPDPVAMIAGMQEGEINKNTLLAANAIIPVMKDFEFDLNFVVTSFTMGTIINGDWIPKRNSGNQFSGEMSEIIRNAKRGQKFFFESIQVEGPDGSKRTLSPINLTIQ